MPFIKNRQDNPGGFFMTILRSLAQHKRHSYLQPKHLSTSTLKHFQHGRLLHNHSTRQETRHQTRR
jgi:hypothetical protein